MCYVIQHAVVRYCSAMLRAATWRGFISCIGHMCPRLRQAEFAYGRRPVLNRLKIPRVSPRYCFVGGAKFPQKEGSAVIHRKKNDLIYKAVTLVCVTASGKANLHVNR